MLSKKVTFYVPSTKNVGQPLTRKEEKSLIERVETEFSRAFGGVTSVTGTGGWLSESGKVIRERVTLVTSYHDKDTREALAIVIPLAQSIKSEYGQEAIAVETEQGIEFI
jgi:hypothetical protein